MRTEFEAARDWCIDLLAIAGVRARMRSWSRTSSSAQICGGYCRTG